MATATRSSTSASRRCDGRARAARTSARWRRRRWRWFGRVMGIRTGDDATRVLRVTRARLISGLARGVPADSPRRVVLRARVTLKSFSFNRDDAFVLQRRAPLRFFHLELRFVGRVSSRDPRGRRSVTAEHLTDLTLYAVTEWNVWCTCLPLLWISAFFLCAFLASSSDLRRSSFFSNLSCSLQCLHVIPTFFGSSSCLCEKSFFARISPHPLHL
mmetsp:Transcript_6341/g.24480  ORF Transcript_6341/g.24480 Transcript_6341/m.24480 type:complete len:215 (+) Transcript_6341:879-1523(+)